MPAGAAALCPAAPEASGLQSLPPLPFQLRSQSGRARSRLRRGGGGGGKERRGREEGGTGRRGEARQAAVLSSVHARRAASLLPTAQPLPHPPSLLPPPSSSSSSSQPAPAVDSPPSPQGAPRPPLIVCEGRGGGRLHPPAGAFCLGGTPLRQGSPAPHRARRGSQPRRWGSRGGGVARQGPQSRQGSVGGGGGTGTAERGPRSGEAQPPPAPAVELAAAACRAAVGGANLGKAAPGGSAFAEAAAAVYGRHRGELPESPGAPAWPRSAAVSLPGKAEERGGG